MTGRHQWHFCATWPFRITPCSVSSFFFELISRILPLDLLCAGRRIRQWIKSCKGVSEPCSFLWVYNKYIHIIHHIETLLAGWCSQLASFFRSYIIYGGHVEHEITFWSLWPLWPRHLKSFHRTPERRGNTWLLEHLKSEATKSHHIDLLPSSIWRSKKNGWLSCCQGPVA